MKIAELLEMNDNLFKNQHSFSFADATNILNIEIN